LPQPTVGEDINPKVKYDASKMGLSALNQPSVVGEKPPAPRVGMVILAAGIVLIVIVAAALVMSGSKPNAEETTTTTTETTTTTTETTTSTTTTSETTTTTTTTTTETTTTTTIKVACMMSLDCGNPYQERVCLLGDIYLQNVKPACVKPRTAESRCIITTSLVGQTVRSQAVPVEECKNGCRNATCLK